MDARSVLLFHVAWCVGCTLSLVIPGLVVAEDKACRWYWVSIYIPTRYWALSLFCFIVHSIEIR